MGTTNINLTNVQPTLESGTNIKTINGNSILGSGNLTIAAGVAIGDEIGDATAGSVLFAGVGGILSQANTRLNYSDTLGLTINPSGTIISGFTAGVNIKGADPTLRVTGGNNGYGIFQSGQVTYFLSTSDNWTSFNSGYGSTFRPGYGYCFGGTGSASAMVHVKSAGATDIGLIVEGATAQEANLQEWRNVGGSVLASINKIGDASVNTVKLTGNGTPSSPVEGQLWYENASGQLFYSDGFTIYTLATV